MSEGFGSGFVWILIGATVSSIGSGMAPIGVAFAVLTRTHSTATIAAVFALSGVAFCAAVIPAGVLADRMAPDRLVLASAFGGAASQAAFGGAYLVGERSSAIYCAIALLGGASAALGAPATQALLGAVVAPEDLTRATSWLYTLESGAAVLSPAVAGWAVAFVGAGAVLILDAGTYLVQALAMWKLRRAWPAASTDEARDPGNYFGGLAFLRARRPLAALMVGGACLTMLVQAPVVVLGPSLSLQYLSGPKGWGLLMSVYAAGVLAGGTALMRTTVSKPFVLVVVAGFLTAAFPFSLGIYPDWGVLVPVALASGVAYQVGLVTWDATLLSLLPHNLVGKVFSIDWLLNRIARPVGFLVAALLAENRGTRPALAIVAATGTAVWTAVAVGAKNWIRL
jgi:MFS family permease